MTKLRSNFTLWGALLAVILSVAVLPRLAQSQDQGGQPDQDDPPGRVARLGFMEGSVSFQPAGEADWVQAVPNRPMTTGDKLWADKDSRVELQLGSAVIRLNENTGFSFLNLDDNTVQIQLTAGSINLHVRRLNDNDAYEVDTPNLAFTVSDAGNYRIEASDDGTYTVVGIREGAGQATGNGQTYTLHDGQKATFSGTDSLNADVVDIGDRDQFDTWAYNRDLRFEHSRSAQYLAPDVVGYEDLDENGDWRDDPSYGHVWFPTQVAVGWAPYHEGHWDWIEPWGYTWVDDSAWGYAPFHYGRWVSVGGQWGWVAGPVAVRAVYAPALVVFIGGGGGFGGNVAWFPLGPREVFVPTYAVSRGYMTRVNISNTTVNTTIVTNVYNTTIINKSTTITNVTYANQNVRGAVMAVPQHAFASAQPVARIGVAVNAEQIAHASVSVRVAVVPTQQAVLGARASTSGHVAAPPAAVMNRQVVAKRTPPPPPVPFARQQQALAAHPGQPLARSEVSTLRPASAAASHPMVKQAPPGRPATANVGRPGQQPGNQPNARPGNTSNSQPNNRPNSEPNAQPMNRPGNQPNPNERPGANNAAPANRPNEEPNRPVASPSEQNNRPGTNRTPMAEPSQQAPTNRPENARPGNTTNSQPNAQPMNRPGNQPNPNERPGANSAEPASRPEAARPENARPETSRPANNEPAARPEATRPTTPSEPPAHNDRPPAAQSNRPAPAPRATPETAERPAQRTTPPVETRPANPPKQQPKAQTPAEKKQQEEERKKQEKPPGF